MKGIGIPYSPACVRDEHLFKGCTVCKFCGKHIFETQRKDFDSFTSRRYAAHYEQYHRK